jgi:hypothetical protein
LQRHRAEALGNAWQLRQLAQLLSIVALFANSALLPTLHFAAQMSTGLHAATSFESSHHHNANPAGGGEKGPHDLSHQVCHFCRLLGAALPPPPSTEIAITSAPRGTTWAGAPNIVRVAGQLGSANSARGPPPTV